MEAEQTSSEQNVSARLLYHVPMSQVWEGSRGRQRGNYHIHVTERLARAGFVREVGRSLCGKRGWYEHDEPRDAPICPTCLTRAKRWSVEVPAIPEDRRP